MGEETKGAVSQHSFVRKANTLAQCSRKRYLLFCVAWVATLIFFGISTSSTHTAFAAQASTHRARTLSSTPTAGGSVTSTPAAGPTGATITVNGSGWQSVPDGTPITFDYSTDPTCATSYTAVASTSEQPGSMSSGAFSGWFRWPTTTPIGTYTVCASIGSTIVAASTYNELSATSPQLTASPSTVNVGQQETITGSNFLPALTSITLVLQQLNGGASVTLGKVTSDANGAFSKAYTIPNNPTGPVAVIANGGGTPPPLTASATFIVYVTPVTPTPTPTPRPTPSPTPQPAPTPTAIPTQKQQQVATPAPTPTLALGPATASAVTTATPTTVVSPQQPASTPTSTPGSGHSDNTTIAMIAGTLFLFLATAIAGLLFWKRRMTTQQQTSSFYVDPQAAQAMSPWNPIRDPFSPVAPDPIAAPPITPNSVKNASSFAGYAGYAPLTIPATNYPGTVGASAGYSRDRASGSTPGGVGYQNGAGYPGNDTYPGANSHSGQNESDLLHDPLFAAIMQQTRSGLFVLPGKKEE